MNTIVKSYITRLGGHILIKRYLRSRKYHLQMNTIVKSYITKLVLGGHILIKDI